MESQDATTQLLKNKYNLHKTPEVDSAAKRARARIGERVPQDPILRIHNYLNRFHEITDREDIDDRVHGIDAAKRFLHSKFVIRSQDVPESYFQNQQRMARELGHGDIEITDEIRRQNIDVITRDQETSLDKWVDYLASTDAPYSDALKYFALRSVLAMGEYDKQKHAFTQRSKGTVKPFPDLNREALAYALSAIDKKYKGQNIDLSALEEDSKKEFEQLLKSENFPKLYAFAIEKVIPASADQLLETRGQWIKYNQGADATTLFKSLQGYGTGWCTAGGESTAQIQLQGGDFHTYYSFDEAGKPTIPRVAIRMQGLSIAEVRGIAPEQNLDPYIGNVVEKKLAEFPDGAAYKKKSADMKRLTEIERRANEGQQLSSEDLIFLYEVDSPIEGFGYEKDPRIEELCSQRNPREDMPIVFECSESQIARTISEIRSDTRAYVGLLEKGIFDKLRDVEHIYTSFPEGKISKNSTEIGGKNAKQLRQELEQANINISSNAQAMLRSHDFKTLSSAQTLDTVTLKVADLDLGINPTTNQIYARAKELGLELCPAELGPHMRLKDIGQALGEWYLIAMKQITVTNGYPRVFNLGHDGGGLWLDDRWVDSDDRWLPRYRFVFSLRK